MTLVLEVRVARSQDLIAIGRTFFRGSTGALLLGDHKPNWLHEFFAIQSATPRLCLAGMHPSRG
jgi:hypothetical protein